MLAEGREGRRHDTPLPQLGRARQHRLRHRQLGRSARNHRYDEYGQPQGTNLGVWGYTGQAWLPNLNVWYYKARMYESEAGRFLQPDPIGYADSPNLYAYVLNDPVNFTDPLGLDGDEIVVTALRIALFGTGGDVFAGGGRGGPSYSAYVEQLLEQQQQEQEIADIECAADPNCTTGQEITVTGTKLAQAIIPIPRIRITPFPPWLSFDRGGQSVPPRKPPRDSRDEEEGRCEAELAENEATCKALYPYLPFPSQPLFRREFNLCMSEAMRVYSECRRGSRTRPFNPYF